MATTKKRERQLGSRKPSAARPERLYDRFIDANDQKERSAFQERYEELRDRAMESGADVDGVNLLSLLHRLDPFAGVEDSIRRASFVQGFEVCVSLLRKRRAR